MSEVGVLDRSDAQVVDTHSARPLAARFGEIRALCFVGLGLVATVAWIALLGWLLYRAVLVLGFA